ncbi:MAG: alpha/beta fold hydrolase [Deltaproteobacteria bacterium]
MLLPATLAFDQPSPETIAEHLVPEPFTETRPVEAHASAISADSPTTSREVAHCERLSHLNAGSRLFCFHDAGGAASMFLPLVQMAGAGVEIHTISHNRLAPPDSQRGRQYLKAAVAYVRSLSDRPYAFFGHSVGALLAWRVAQEIVEGGGLQPLFLAPSGAPPVTPVEGFALDVSIVMDALLGARTVVTPASLASFQSDFATDLALWQMLPPTSKRPFPIPIAAFLGSEDTFVTQPAMKTWGGQTTRDFSITVLPGDHFYPHRKELQQALAKELARAFFDASFSSITHDELATRRIGRERKVAIEP